MPTGYTAGIADGSITTLREYALTCARGMGALIMMRDEPMDAPIPDAFTPSTYHADNLAKAKANLADLSAMGAEAKAAAAAKGNAENDTARAAAVSRNDETRNRYNAMLADVIKWEGAPEGLKDFMSDQLVKSREFDCSDEPLKYYPAPRSVDEWHTAAVAEALRAIEYHTEELAKETERVAERNAWLAQLRAALPAA